MEVDWNERYRQGDTPWDKGRASPALVAWLNQNRGVITGPVLIPGCGTGHDVRAVATAEPASFPLGIDISEIAVRRCRQQKTCGNEGYRKANLFALPEDLMGTFNWVVEHTCFCAIDPEKRHAYVSAVAASLKPEGLLLGIFYLNPRSNDDQPSSGPPHGTTIKELESLFLKNNIFTITKVMTPAACYPEREGRERLVLLRKTSKRLAD